MQQDLDSLMAGTIASPPPTTSVHAALQGLLSENGTGGEFADLLAEFTLPRHAMSPEALGRSPGVSAGGSAREDAGEGYHQSTTREQHLLAHLGLAAKDTGHGYGYGVEQERSVAVEQAGHLADAIAGLDPASQSQLLAALLSQASAASTAAPMQPYQQPPQFGRRDSSPASYRSQPRQPDQRPSPSHLSQPSSRHGSPQAFHMHDAAGSPYHQQQQYQVAVSIAQQAAMNASLPPSLVSSPLASPHMHATTPSPYYAQRSPLEQFQQQQLQQQQLQQQVQQQQQQQQQFAMHLAHGHTGSPLQAFPQPPLVQNGFARQAYSNSGYPVDSQSPGGGQYGPTPGSDRRGRGRSATGESYATTADTEEWRENEVSITRLPYGSGELTTIRPQFLFSPLMSPALTPHSVYSQASSLPPSASCLPPNHQSMNLVSPSDFFSPLSSPAIMPVTYGTDFNATGVWTAPQQLPINATLQGLVDQTQALAFDPVTLSALQGSPHLYAQGQNMSPRMVAVDAGMSTATGSGRRGASSKKARPSPLLKATPDVVPKRKKAPSGSEKRANSISNGGRSATTSPFMGPTYGTVASSSGLTRSSPPEGLLDGSSGSVNTPSPVDLAMNGDVSTKYLPELMGPPPPPSSSSRRTSLIGDPGIDTATWLNPVTPATFMNFPSDLGAAGLSSLAPQFPTHHYPDVKGTFPDTTPLGLESISADTSGSSTATGSTAAAKGKGKKVTAKAAALSAAAAAGTSIAAVKGKGKAATTTGTLGTRKLAAKPAKLAMKPPVAGCESHFHPLRRVPALTSLDAAGLSDSVSRAAARAVGDDGDSAPPAVDNRRTSHKAAEQKRRDSLKQCFEELRRILPPLADGAQNDEDRRPGEGNVGGQRGGSVDPENPNRGVSKVALLRRSNEFVGTLYDRVDRRDLAIEALRAELERVRAHAGVEGGFNLDGFHLDNLDKDEKQAGTMESCTSRIPFSPPLLVLTAALQMNASTRTTRRTIDQNRKRRLQYAASLRTSNWIPSSRQDLDALLVSL